MGGLNIHDVVKAVGPGLGVRCGAVSGYPHLLRLDFPAGRPLLLSRQHFDLNPAAAADMARVKAWSLYFLREAGFSVPEFDVFFADTWAADHQTTKNVAAARAYAERLGYPLVIKPSCKSLGQGVHIVMAPSEFGPRVAEVTPIDPMFLVQRLIRGTEYRVVVLDGAVKLAYRKSPFLVVGDGSSTCQELIVARLQDLATRGYGVSVRATDPRIDSYLTGQGLKRESVLPAGERCQVSLTAGFVSGGELREAFDDVPAEIRDVAPRIVRQAGMRYAGLDILTPDRRAEGEPGYYVIDVNSGPVLGDYALLGPEQYGRVEGLVRDLLIALAEAARP